MTVHEFKGLFSYAVPDTATMKQAKSQFDLKVADKTYAFAPAVQEKLEYLRTQINDADHQLFEHIKRVQTSLCNVSFESTLARIAEIEGNEQAAATTRTKKIEELVMYCVQRVTSSLAPVLAAQDHLVRELAEIGGITLVQEGAQWGRPYETRREAQERRRLVLNSDLNELAEELRRVDETLQQFKSPTWIDLFKGMIPTVQEIEAALKLVSTQKPDREFLELALKRLNGNLDGIEQGRQYANFVEARNSIHKRMDELRVEVKDVEKELLELNRTLNKLNEISVLDQSRLNWLQEAQKVARAYDHFLATAQPEMLRDAVSIKQMAARYGAMLGYLKTIKKA
ncbi:alpha-xenorhabdolysin family binary toxin subunit B [Pseudomonas sp. 6D_7.1_Bac1]|uniref:alpha-xenorhabdolysin family binary toxin subunit B n=1 Tax=Pseudomonas sp. 6D_7.1_Bac1 TaxID=2971615 RepID=UPI0021C58178|nr:alpha-xenorhabdolysin family binary toxin subunit B [Pseudomonas sp. 6D_7.1_Bac1]MCU1751264.1 alpha-xenorhabdolysin family binary toxin subunit B [Pseudomonas sp. 6D_7.1_Bac1]